MDIIKIRYAKKALKFFSKAEKTLVNNIKDAINKLTKTPPEGDIKALSGYKDGRKRLRYGKYRIIFRYDESIEEKDEKEVNIIILLIINIGSRGDIYKED